MSSHTVLRTRVQYRILYKRMHVIKVYRFYWQLAELVYCIHIVLVVQFMCSTEYSCTVLSQVLYVQYNCRSTM